MPSTIHLRKHVGNEETIIFSTFWELGSGVVARQIKED